MDFAFSEQQDLLRTSARQFLERECPPDMVRRWSDDPQGYSPDLWQTMAAFGWMGLVLPETYGGSGLSFVDLTILLPIGSCQKNLYRCKKTLCCSEVLAESQKE